MSKKIWKDNETGETPIYADDLNRFEDKADLIKLLDVINTAPTKCSKGDKYYNTTDKKIYTATGTNVWGTTGETPETTNLYLNMSNGNHYCYDGVDFITYEEEKEVYIGSKSTAPTNAKLVIEETENHNSVSGTEISITDGIDSPVKRLRQYGYTKQDGTPTLDTPVEIEVATGKNLLSVPFTQYNANNLRTEIPNFKAGTYTFSFKGSLTATWQVTARKIVNGTPTQINSVYNAYSLTFTLDEDATLQLEVYRTGILLTEIDKAQLEKGDVATSYSAPKSISARSTGKNLISSTKKIGNAIYLNGTTKQADYVFKAGTYTISYVNANATAVYIKTSTTNNTRLGANNPLTFTVSEDFNVWLYRDGMTEGELSNIQLELGEVATDYEPYKESSLHYHLGDNFLADKDYIENGVLNKSIVGKVLNGTENYSLWSTNVFMLVGKLTDKLVAKSSHFEFVETRTAGELADGQFCLSSDSNGCVFLFKISSCETVEDFKTWLSNNNVEIYYELETPEQIQLETTGELRTFEPNTIITNDLDSEMEVDYATAPNVNMYYRNSNGSLNKVYM